MSSSGPTLDATHGKGGLGGVRGERLQRATPIPALGDHRLGHGRVEVLDVVDGASVLIDEDAARSGLMDLRGRLLGRVPFRRSDEKLQRPSGVAEIALDDVMGRGIGEESKCAVDLLGQVQEALPRPSVEVAVGLESAFRGRVGSRGSLLRKPSRRSLAGEGARALGVAVLGACGL